MRHIIIFLFLLFVGSLYGQVVRVDSTVVYESRSIYNQAGYYIGKDSFHVKQVKLAYCNDTFYERIDTLIGRYPLQLITMDSLGLYATKSQVRDSIGTIDSDHDGVADDADLLDGETGSYYLNRANHYGNQDTLSITGLGEFTEDRMASKIIAGTGITKSYNDSTGELTINSTASGSITQITVTDYLTGGGTSGTVTIGIDTSGTVGMATKYDLIDKIDGSGLSPFIPIWTDENSLGYSNIYQDNENLFIGIGQGGQNVILDTREAIILEKEDYQFGTIKGRFDNYNQNGTIIGHNVDKDLNQITGSFDSYTIDIGGTGYSTISTATEGVFINKIDDTPSETNLFTVKNDGKVGIGGVTDPSATLHVSGTMKITSQTGTPTKILGVDASGSVGELTKGYAVGITSGELYVDSIKIGEQIRDSIGTLDSNHDGNADNASKLEGQGSSYYLSRANHTGTQDTSTISGLGEFVEDRAGSKIVAGTGISTSYNDSTGETTITATGGGGGLSAEEVRDTVVNMFKKVGSSITFNETDSADSIFLDVNLNPTETMVSRTNVGKWSFNVCAQGSTSLSGYGYATTTTGSANNSALGGGTAIYKKRTRLQFNQGAASTTNVAGVRGTNELLSMELGFVYSITWGQSLGVSNTTKRAFVGVRGGNANISDITPNSMKNIIGFGWDDANDNNIQFYYNDGSGTASQIDLGSSWTIPTLNETDVYTIIIYVPYNQTIAYYKIINEANGTSSSGSVNTNLPASTVFMNPHNYVSVGGTSAVTGFAFFNMSGYLMDNY